MARPAVKEVKLKRGFYIEVSSRGSQKGIKIRRESYDQIQAIMRYYENSYQVRYLGEVENGKVKTK